jgi:hypothetical protein
MRKYIKAINRAIRRLTVTEPCPGIRWDDVVRIDALGTDVLGAFEISVTFVYTDNSEVTVFVHHKGYDEILESLPQRFPSIPLTWYDEMAEEPWHVERVLYERESIAGSEELQTSR